MCRQGQPSNQTIALWSGVGLPPAPQAFYTQNPPPPEARKEGRGMTQQRQQGQEKEEEEKKEGGVFALWRTAPSPLPRKRGTPFTSVTRGVLIVALLVVTVWTSSCCAEGEERGEIAESAAAYYEVHGRVVAATNTTRIILHGNGGQLSQLPTTKDGLFRIKDLPSGAYLLEVVSNEHLYPLLRVDVSAKHNGKVKARLAGDSAKSKSLSYPLNIEPLAPMQFFEERKGFNFLELFKNPMVIMMGVTLVMILVVPKLMDSEAMKEAQAQAQGQNPLEMLTNWGESNAAPSSSNANSTSESAKNRARRKKNQ